MDAIDRIEDCELMPARKQFAVFGIALAVFGGSCLQTGQTSILFVVCWLGYVLATSLGRSSWAGLALALPAAIKLYPLVFGIVPLIRRKWIEVPWGLVGLTLLVVVIPALVFRENFIELTKSFFAHQVLDPGGRVMTAASPTAVSNQGLDAVLLRYASYIPGLHNQPGAPPHLNFDPQSVLLLGNFLRVLIIAFTAFVSLKWLHAREDEPPLLLMALWCAALYMVLPGAKSRYAIYALPAMLTMFAAAHREFANGCARDGARIATLAVVACALLLQMVPAYLLQFGVGYVGTLILWLFTVREAWETSALPRRAGQNYASSGERASDVL